MSRRLVGFFLAWIFTGLVLWADGPVVLGETHHLHSTLLKEDRRYSVHLPASYAWSPDKHYPVLYLLDGQTHFVHASAAVDFLTGQGEIPEMIVVGIDSTVRVRDFTQTDWPQAWIGGGGAATFRAFLAKELIPEIERAYRTDDYRLLSGHSAGGQFALYCLVSEPNLFQAYLALSPSLNWDGQLPLRSLETCFASKPAIRAFVYAACGDDRDDALADFNRLAEDLTRKAPPGLRAKCQAFPEETHTGLPLLGQIDALRALYEGWRAPEAVRNQGLAAVEAHYQQVSKRFGRPVPVPERALNDLGYAALQEGKIQEAIALFRRNAEANPRSANAQDSLADGLLQGGRLQEAKAAEDRALELARRAGDPNLGAFERQAKKIEERIKGPGVEGK